MLQYLSKLGKNNITDSTPDVSVKTIRNTNESKSLVSTIDFFYPLVEDPYMQGRIACCNVLSDLFSMGIDKIDTILMVLGISTKMNEAEREVVTSLMI